MPGSVRRQLTLDLGRDAAAAYARKKRDWRRRHPNTVFLAAKPSAEEAALAMGLTQALWGRRGIRREWRDEALLHSSIWWIGAFQALSRDALPSDVTAALCAGDMVEAHAFRAEFDLLQSFKDVDEHGRPTWRIVLCSRDCTAWMPLIDQVATALRRAGLRSFSPAAFKPHMTLIYRGWWMPVEVLDRPIAWTVRDLLLVNSIFGQTTHEHLAEWSLQA